MAGDNVGSFQTIKIHRMIPIVNRSLQLEPNLEKYRNVVEPRDVPVSPPYGVFTCLGDTGGASTAGSKYGVQELYELPGIALDEIDEAYNSLKAYQRTL